MAIAGTKQNPPIGFRAANSLLRRVPRHVPRGALAATLFLFIRNQTLFERTLTAGVRVTRAGAGGRESSRLKTRIDAIARVR